MVAADHLRQDLVLHITGRLTLNAESIDFARMLSFEGSLPNTHAGIEPGQSL